MRSRQIYLPSRDDRPWRHPFLTSANLTRFHDFSDRVHAFAAEVVGRKGLPETCIFTVNMAQNMYKWTNLAIRSGIDSCLIPHPMDTTAISDPRWEDFSGEFPNIFDGQAFNDLVGDLETRVPVNRVDLLGGRLLEFVSSGAIHSEIQNRLGGRYCELLEHEGCAPYFEWAYRIGTADVSYAASSPIASYASGKPYLAFSVGGDLQMDCGLVSGYGEMLRKSFGAAAFLLASNPHTLGHCRRLGLENAVHVPYPMDDSRYAPGDGSFREIWQKEKGGEVFVLTTARIDSHVKGYGHKVLRSMRAACEKQPDLRFVFLNWGESLEKFRATAYEFGLADFSLFLPPVGKERLIDYYRSADIVMDQFTYGYFGASSLEALSVGRPVIMFLRTHHYQHLYAGDLPPVISVEPGEQLAANLIQLASSRGRRLEIGHLSRDWLIRNHGEGSAGTKMMNLLATAAHSEKLPEEIRILNPLLDTISDEEDRYHQGCVVQNHGD